MKICCLTRPKCIKSIYIKSHGSFFALTSLPGVNYTLYVYSSVYVIGSNGDKVGKASLSLSLSLSRLEKFCAAPRLVAQRKRQGFLTSVTWVRASACTPVTPAVSYLPTGLAGCSVDPRISCGTRKLARTPRVTKKKKRVWCQQSIQGVDITQKPVKKNVFAIQAKQDA